MTRRRWTNAEANVLRGHLRTVAAHCGATEDDVQEILMRATAECDPNVPTAWKREARRWLEGRAKSNRRRGARHAAGDAIIAAAVAAQASDEGEIVAGSIDLARKLGKSAIDARTVVEKNTGKGWVDPGKKHRRRKVQEEKAVNPDERRFVRREHPDGGASVTIELATPAAEWLAKISGSDDLRRELERLSRDVRALRHSVGITPYLDDVIAERAARIRKALAPDDDRAAATVLVDRIVKDAVQRRLTAEEVISRAKAAEPGLIPFVEKLATAEKQLQDAIDYPIKMVTLLKALGLAVKTPQALAMTRGRVAKRHPKA